MIEWGGWGGQPRLLKVPILQQEIRNSDCSKSLDSLLFPPACLVPRFSFPLSLPWMTLPVSEVIKRVGEAQSRTGRRAQSRSQEA